jgi:O-antigen ligase
MNSEIQSSKPVEKKNIFIMFFYAFLVTLAFSAKIADIFAFFMLLIFLYRLFRREIKLDDSIVMLSIKLLIGAYFLTFLFSLIHSTNYYLSFLSFFSYASPFFLYIILSSIELSQKQFENSLLLIICSSCAAFIFFFFISHPPYSINHRLGFLGHPNQAALYIGMVCIVLFSSLAIKHKRFMQIGKLGMLLVGLTVLICTYTRSVWMGLFAGTGILTLLAKNRRILLLFLILVVVFGAAILLSSDLDKRFQSIFEVHHPNNTSRLTIWSTAFEVFNNQKWFAMGPNKLTGIGPKNYKQYFQKIHPHYFENVPHPHNDYLESLTEFGILGLLCFLFFELVVYYYSFQTWRHASTDLQRMLGNIVMGLIVVWTVHGMVDLTRSKKAAMYLLLVMLAFLRQSRNWSLEKQIQK